MNLAERHNELAMLDRLQRTCAQGTSNIAWISGSVASGKTALLEAFAERLTAAGTVVLRATTSPAEQTLSLGVLGQLFRSPDVPPDIAEQVAELLDGGTLSALADEPDPASLTNLTASIFERLGQLLIELTRRGPVVVLVDDVQYVDVLSLQCLLYFVRRTRTTGVLIVFTECTQHPPVDPVLHAEMLRQPNCHRVRLSLLSREGVTALLADHTDPSVTRKLADACHAVTGGNPLLVHALIEDSRVGRGGIVPALVHGSAFSQAVLTCLYRSGPRMVALAKALAVLDPRATATLIGEIIGESAETVPGAIESLRAAGLLGAHGFRHPSARNAVLQGMTPDEYAALHRRAANALHEHGAAASTLAPHVVAAEISAPWVAPVLREAAEQALADGRTDAAVTYLRRTLKEQLDGHHHAAVEAALARAEWRVNPVLTTQHLPALSAALRTGHLHSAQAKELVLYQLWSGQTGDVIDSLATLARQPARYDGDRRREALDMEEIRLWLCGVFPELAKGIQADQTVGRPTAAIMPVGLKGASVLAATLTGSSDESTLVAATQILRSSRLDSTTLVPLLAALIALLCADEMEQATTWCDALLAEASERGVPTWQALLSAVSSAIALRRGALPAAELHAMTALDLLGPQGWGVAVGVPLAYLLLARTAAGKQEEAAATLHVPVPVEMFQTPAGLLYVHARGRHYLATGHVHAALEDFQSCGELMIKWGQDSPTVIPWRADAVKACLLLRRTGLAEELASQQMALACGAPQRTRGVALRALALTSPLRKRPALLSEAADLLRESGDQLELASTYIDLSHVYEALGQYDRAAASGRIAHALAAQCGASQLCGNLRYVSETDMKPDTGPEACDIAKLSNAERRVAMLAAHGYTNGQISNKLHVTVSTVEQHLTKVYRKLRVNRRSELPQNLQAQ
ncbi:MAG TPA: AAA family ATPase [Pseudonocardiaceae bacterium]|nr:AAA family ATPase [Pseudonocardiaceae bacterium]